MWKIFEIYFDLLYLLAILCFGLRMLLEKGKKAKILSSMAILLALGDACHLLPRIYAHLSPLGLNGYIKYLSYGEMITGITMSIFYLLFFFYYKSLGGKITKARKSLFFMLFAHRILFLLLPTNNWGAISPYSAVILRNIPFLIMGILLIIWTYNDRHLGNLGKVSYLIAGSFFFYTLVITISPFITIFGAFMIPKTICYIGFIYLLYRQEVDNFNELSLLKTSITFLELGLILGVFYREFTKLFHVTSMNKLSLAHTHMLILGFIFFLLLYIIVRFEKCSVANIKKSYEVYLFGLIYFISSLILRGIYQVASQNQALYSEGILAGLAGIGHLILGGSLIYIMIQIYLMLNSKITCEL